MRVLVVYELVPEETYFFILENEEAEVAIKCHGKFINSDESDDLDELDKILTNHTKMDINEPIPADNIDKIILTGLIL